MQDRFKFRAFHKPTNFMFEVYGFNNNYVFANTLDGVGTQYNPCLLEDCVLMQCTGFKDKNGKLIYEGDIVKSKGCIYRIDFDDVRFASFVLVRVDRLNMFKHYFGEAVDSNEIKVIGNIHENGDLLEKINVSNQY